MPTTQPRPQRARRKASQQVLWGTLYALIIACTGLLGYLGLGGPQLTFGQDIPDIRVPASERGTPDPDRAEPAEPADSALPRSSWIDDTPDSTTAATTSFFGIPVD